MATLDDVSLENSEDFEVAAKVGVRSITCMVHDMDRTHSLIRDEAPVMSLIIHYAMMSGLPDDFDSPENAQKLVEKFGKEQHPETDHFCAESAGLSILTQMEFGVRRAIEIGKLQALAGLKLKNKELVSNALITKKIWSGEERFDDVKQSDTLKTFLDSITPRLFKLYETVLFNVSRDKNLAEARLAPENWRVAGSMDFVRQLHGLGVKNYFLTSAVLSAEGGLLEELGALGYEIGEGKPVEALEGVSWEKKLPKEEMLRALFNRLGVEPSNALVVGGGRTIIKAATDMGAVTLARLPKEAKRVREQVKVAGVNYIVEDYTSPALAGLIR